MKVLCIGEILIDFTPRLDMENSYIANPGGAPANVAVSVQRCGGQAGFLGKTGDDAFGKMLIATLEKEGVKVLCPKPSTEAVTTLAFVSLDKNNDRSFTFVRKPGADLLLSEEDVNAVEIGDWDIVHAGSVSQSGTPEREAVLSALKKAKELGKMVSFDINYRETIWSREACREQVTRVLPYVDLLKISQEELEFVGGEEHIPAFMAQHNITVVVLTLGGNGSKLFFGQSCRFLPARTVPVTDTTGAGDSYWGTFLCQLLSQGIRSTADITMEKLVRAGEYGTIASSLCIQRPGGIPALASKEEIEAHLSK